MEKNKGKITIKDVARMAGVSRGTVDRVIHNRGDVSRQSHDDVMRVIKDIGFEPNIYASILAHDKSRSIALLLPSFRPGEYWEMAGRGASLAQAYARTFNVSIETFLYDQYDLESFRAALQEHFAAGDGELVLSPEQTDEISALCDTKYATERWIMGRWPEEESL